MTRILNASGCLDALVAPEVAAGLDVFVTKTVTPLPRTGNDPIRIAESDVGMLNSIGLANPGIERFVAEYLPEIAERTPALWVSVGGFSAEDFALCCAALDGYACIDVIELNVSCPNVTAPADEASAIVAAARGVTSKPLYAKLSPALPDIVSVAQAAEQAGAQGLSLTNTLRGLMLDPATLEPILATATGGLSGPALRPVALAAVYACAQATSLPIVGMGGVETGEHALALIAAGASDVALGTVLFGDPAAPHRIRTELEEAAQRRGVASAAGVFRMAHRDQSNASEVSSKTCDRGESLPELTKIAVGS